MRYINRRFTYLLTYYVLFIFIVKKEKTWWDFVVDGVESLGLSKQTRSLAVNGELSSQPANPGSCGKWPLKRNVYFYVLFTFFWMLVTKCSVIQCKLTNWIYVLP